MSAFIAAESLRWWCREWTVVLASMRRRTNILPAGMTFAAKASLPIKESRARLVHFCRGLKWVSSCRVAVSLACGRRAIWVMVLSSMPRNVMHVVGGAFLCLSLDTEVLAQGFYPIEGGATLGGMWRASYEEIV